MSKVYKDAGVDIHAGYEAVSRMKKHVAKTNRAGVIGGLGGFGGMFDLSALDYKEPVLVSGTDGVGTKLKLAFMMDKHDTIGIDAVAMCVNDILAQGAEPLFFLDYLGVGKAVPEKIEQIVKGVADGCEEAGCALIGGETAEMPGVYDEEEYDIAGFAVGAVEKSKMVTGENIKEGDVLIGLASNGIHSNGFSLVRKILLEQHQLNLHERYEPLTETLGEELLKPTKIYVRAVLNVLKKYEIRGMAHITGGGFFENIPRMLKEGLGAEIDFGSWPIPSIFTFLQEKGNLSQKDMFEVFNMGIGYILVVEDRVLNDVIRVLEGSGEKAYIIGRIQKGHGITFGGGKLE